jgi:hypothetical protein
MRLFRLWTRDELVTAIRALEEALASGVQSISYTGGGDVAQVAAADMTRTLQSLYDRLDEIDGTPKEPRVRHVRIRPSKGIL